MSTGLVIALAAGLSVLASLAIQIAWICTAPQGWEDDATFHLGEDTRPQWPC